MNQVAWRNCYTLEAVDFIRWDREGPQRDAPLCSERPTLKVQRPTPNRVNDYEPLNTMRGSVGWTEIAVRVAVRNWASNASNSEWSESVNRKHPTADPKSRPLSRARVAWRKSVTRK
ncbi:MAG: hypothetical protein Udaeo2_32500 [Candidatus Udaeobacter sp.]|nr:MAG: hypothetical protein Udaeo2_32500 [Candidatus Udaeobacter sp.]